MALDINQIRDEFVALAKKRGLRVEQLSPTRGYTFAADVYAESARLGRLLMRKTTVSWRPKGSKKLQRLTTLEDVGKTVNAFAAPAEEEETVVDKTATKAPPPPRRSSARAAKKPPPSKRRKTLPDAIEAEEPADEEKIPKIDSQAAESAVPESPQRQPTSLSRAVSMFKEGDFKKALDWARLALAENPESAAAKDVLERAQRLLSAETGRSVEEQQEAERVEAATIESPTAAAVRSEPDGVPVPESLPKTRPATPPPAAREGETESTRRRLSPWAVVALMAAILGIIIFKPPYGGSGRRAHEELAEDTGGLTTSDSLALLRQQAAHLEEIVDTDVVGKPAGELIPILIHIIRLDPSDTATCGVLRDQALRADSLAVSALESNQFSMTRTFLDEALVGWQELLLRAPADSLLSERIARNNHTRDILDIRRASFANMVFVPEGMFRMGSDAAGFDARPERGIELSAFWADKFEVTNREYQAFLLATGADGPSDRRSEARPYSWSGSAYPEGTPDYPVVLVTWEEANRLAQWLGKTLPTEAQWERVARGTDGRHYPWGATFDQDSLGCPEQKPAYSRVGACTGDESPCGAHDCAGSVREWTSDWYDPEYYLRSSSRVKDPKGPRGGREKVVRGGSWREESAIAGLTHRRSSLPPTVRAVDLGFRLVIADSLYPDELRESKNALR